MIDIKDTSNLIRFSTPINEGSKRKFLLMKEDYITLKFKLENPVVFKLGDYVDDTFGLFELTDPYKPTYNNTDGAYDYDLRLDAHYWKWKNKIFKFMPEAAGSEASWNLTADLATHMGVFLRNLVALGYTYRKTAFSISIDGTVESSSKLMSYDNTNLLDALTKLAEAWECEWWVTDSVIHFGRCEYSDPVDFKLGDNVEEMTSSDSKNTFATRIYAFGSTRNLPTNYRPVDESVVVNGIVQKRLMLPAGTPYIDAYQGMSTEEAIEDVVIFEDVYPRRIGTMSGIHTHEYTDIIKEEGKPDVIKKWNAYRFKDLGITFSEKYVIPGQELRIVFQSETLNGMDFAVTFNPCDKECGEASIPEKNEDGSWNPLAQVWEIVRNEDYGRELPGDTLIPKNGDTYILYGYDTKFVAETMIPEAEVELKEKALKYLEKAKIDPSTYNCKMMSNRMLDSEGKANLLEAGDKVNLINEAYFETGNRQSRIIGFEYNLDFPYDSPVYTVGETASYSRIGALEDKIEALTYKGQTYTGGGGGVYLITSNDSTQPTDRNAYSAKRAKKESLSKTSPDSTPHLLGALGGLEIQNGLTLGENLLLRILISSDTEATLTEEDILSAARTIVEIKERALSRLTDDQAHGHIDHLAGLSICSKRLTDIIRYYDEEKGVSTDASVYSSLMTDQRIEEAFKELDDRYLRKDKKDVAHKHITFEEGITVHQLAQMMNIDVKQLATIAQAVCQILRSDRFVDGFSGEGYQIWKDIATGDWNMTLDRLTVRKAMTIYELIIQKIRAVGGMMVVSAANGKVKTVQKIGNNYVFTFEEENMFVGSDLARCQVFTGKDVKYYWVKVSSVSDHRAIVPESEFAGVIPTAGDEWVLMGNTDNKRRQNFILISATEDGQPRFDCYNGVNTKNFEGCLKVRVGNLDGIKDSRFPADLQPNDYGLYGNNCFLTGVFVLVNGKDVLTMFQITEGLIRSEIASVRQEINQKDNYLNNASFTDNLTSWTGNNRVRVFSVNEKLLMFNNNLYANKERFANIVDQGNKSVLRIKNSSITQLNNDLAKHPEFDEYEQFEKDEEGNEIVTGKLYRPRMFYVSFKYMVRRPGTLHVRFTSEDGTYFEEYISIDYTESLQPGEEFKTMEIAGKWNGTGDFVLSFTGDIYIYALALADNRLADIEEKFDTQFEQTDKKIQFNANEIKNTGKKLEEYHSEFLITAKEIRAELSASLDNLEDGLTEDYKGYVSITAKELTVNYTADISNSETKITAAYTGAINMSAQGLETRFTSDITNMKDGITSAYEGYFNMKADGLTAGFKKDLVNLESGITSAYEGYFNMKADGLTAGFNKQITDINGKLTSHTGKFHVTADKIEGMVSETTTLGTNYSALSIEVGKIKTSVNDFDGRFSAITQEVDRVKIEVSDARGNSATLSVEINRIEGRIGSMEGDLSVFEQTAKRIEASVTASDGRLATLQITANGIDLKVSTANGNIASLKTQADGITQQVTDASKNIATLKTTATAIEGRVSDANNNLGSLQITANGIVQQLNGAEGDITSITTRLGSIESKVVDKNGIISAINQTAESISIDASKINLNGLITANRTFQIDLDGSIKATAGQIGDLYIKNGALSSTNLDMIPANTSWFNMSKSRLSYNDFHKVGNIYGSSSTSISSGNVTIESNKYGTALDFSGKINTNGISRFGNSYADFGITGIYVFDKVWNPTAQQMQKTSMHFVDGILVKVYFNTPF